MNSWNYFIKYPLRLKQKMLVKTYQFLKFYCFREKCVNSVIMVWNRIIGKSFLVFSLFSQYVVILMQAHSINVKILKISIQIYFWRFHTHWLGDSSARYHMNMFCLVGLALNKIAGGFWLEWIILLFWMPLAREFISIAFSSLARQRRK